MPVVKEVACKSILSRSGLPHIDYAVNPYRGCEHGCVYCYARFMKRFTGHTEPWGEFVDVKANAPTILSKEIAKAKKGVASLSTVTDAYQPLEKHYRISRQCLENLLANGFDVDILTKSSLVLRDLDLLCKANRNHVEVGFTVTTIDEKLRRLTEPNASPVHERLQAVEELEKYGIQTYIFFGPLLPTLGDSEESIREAIRSFAESNTNHILVDRLNLRWGVWPSITKFLEQHFPKLMPLYKRIFWSENSYYERLKPRIADLCHKYGVKFEFCY